jgi:hypothetical protein
LIEMTHHATTCVSTSLASASPARSRQLPFGSASGYVRSTAVRTHVSC